VPNRSSPAHRRTVQRRRLVVVATLLSLAAAGIWLSRSGPAPAPPAPAHRHVTVRPEVPRSSVIATLSQPVPAFQTHQLSSAGTLTPPPWAPAFLALPVIASVPGWDEVRIVARPPGSQTAWLPSADAVLNLTPYRIVVALGPSRVLLFRSGRMRMCVPAAVGAASTPTPLGHYFVAGFVEPPEPKNTPFVIVTSAVTAAATDWEQDGNAMVTLEAPTVPGPTGSGELAPTTGGIRLASRDLQRLRGVPAGSPVDIVPGLPARLTNPDRRTCARTLSSAATPA